uniref:E3 ubiquitin-protein ligase HERC4 n=2 Tax=Ascaris suum TaxID=6253 RepID=F1KTV1_ASCSU
MLAPVHRIISAVKETGIGRRRMVRRQLYAFGYGGDGQLGNRGFLNGDDGNIVKTPQVVVGAPTSHDGVSVRAIATGERHTLFLADDGKVWSCGSNENGELGRGGCQEGSFTIYPVLLSGGVNIVQIAAGRAHNMAVADDGRLFAWGSNSHGQLALPSNITSTDIPKRVVSLTETVQVACGTDHTIAIVESGRIFVWGLQPDGRVLYAPKEIEFFMALPVVQVNAGSDYYVALTVSGAMFVWGSNEYGQLGTSDNKERTTPAEVTTLHSLNVVHVACGHSHTVALTHEGRLFVCGSDSCGQLGSGRKVPSQNTMLAVTEMLGTHVTRVACGRCHTLALAGGKMYAFGLNSSGQLGSGNVRSQVTPRPIDALTDVVSVFAGWDQSFCIQSKNEEELSSATSYALQTPKFLSLRRLQEVFNSGDKLSVIGELETAFSSLATLNGSFLYENERRFRCSAQNSCLDMDSIVDASNIICESADAEQYTELILNAVELSGIWDVQWEKPQPIESLRIFLIIPSLYFFSSPTLKLVKAFHLPFVRATHLLTAFSRSTLEGWWSALEPRHFNRLVCSLVSALHQLVDQEPTNDAAALTLCQILATLNRINNEYKKIALDKFYLTILKEKVDISNDYARWAFGEVHGVFAWSNYPFLMDAEVKTMLLHLEAAIQMQLSMTAGATVIFPFNLFVQSDPFFIIRVSRENIVDDAMVALLSSKSIDLKKPLKVIFRGEEGDDAGGVKKEFFMLLFQELLQPTYGMFTENEESHLIWFSGVETDQLSFKLTGILCALAIYNNVLVDFPFPLALYKKILNQSLLLEDLNELSPTEARSLQAILDYDGDDLEEVFALTFVITLSLFGYSKEVELKENGAQIAVTQENKAEFVRLYVAKRLEEGNDGEIAKQLKSFDAGFRTVIHSRILQFFQPQELMEMIIGNENYDWSVFRKNTEYKGVYYADHEAIRCFWDVFFEFSLDQKKKFLQFLMGTTRIPLQGMSAVKMTVQPCDEMSIPVAHTCFNLLDLPPITDREEMRRRLLICLENTHGFTLA